MGGADRGRRERGRSQERLNSGCVACVIRHRGLACYHNRIHTRKGKVFAYLFTLRYRTRYRPRQLIPQEPKVLSSPTQNHLGRAVVAAHAQLPLRAHGNRIFKLIQLRTLRALSKQHIALNPPGRDGKELIAHVRACRHREDIIQLLERALLRLGHPQEDHHQRAHVQAGVEAKRARRPEHTQQPREGDGEHGGPAETGGDGPGHADFAVREGEDFGGVGEGDGAFAGGVKGREEEDEERDHAEVGLAAGRDEEAETGGEEGPGHVGKGEEQESAAAPGVNRPDSRPGKDEIHQTETPGGEQSAYVACACLYEDGGRVEGDDVDAAHLLGQHDHERGEGGATHAGDGEEFHEARDVVALPNNRRLLDDLSVDVIQVTSSLEVRVSQPDQ